jgi:hypothetical protein
MEQENVVQEILFEEVEQPAVSTTDKAHCGDCGEAEEG